MKLLSLCIWLTQACNLQCEYCYERHAPVPFDLEKVQRTVMGLFLDDKMDLDAEEITFAFFGGEPLLEYEAMKEFIAWLEAEIPHQNKRYHITTNGTLITREVAEYLAAKHFGMLFSIDGDQEAMLARSDSYDAAVAALQHVWAVGLNPEANMTFTPQQMNRAAINVQHVADLGFVSYNLNHQIGAQYSYTETLEALLAVFRYHMEHLHRQGIRTSALTKVFRAIELKEKQGLICGAGKGFVAISPEGDVYPCHKLVLIPGTRLAKTGEQINENERGWWRQFDPLENEACDECAVRGLCAGTCAADNAWLCGDFHRPVPADCTFTRAWLTAGQVIYWECTEEERQEVLGRDPTTLC